MVCLSPAAFLLFLATTGLQIKARGPVFIVPPGRTHAFVWRDGYFCTGGQAT